MHRNETAPKGSGSNCGEDLSDSQFLSLDELPPYDFSNSISKSHKAAKNSMDFAPIDVHKITSRKGVVSRIIFALSSHRPTLYFNILLFVAALIFLIICLTITIPVKAGQEALTSSYEETKSHLDGFLSSKLNESEHQRKVVVELILASQTRINELDEARRNISSLQETLRSTNKQLENITLFHEHQRKVISDLVTTNLAKNNEFDEARRNILNLQAQLQLKSDEIQTITQINKNTTQMLLTRDNELVESRKLVTQLQANIHNNETNIGGSSSEKPSRSTWEFLTRLISGANSVDPSYYVLTISLCLTILRMNDN